METKNKIFKDPVHGYINVPNYYAEYLIDNNYFQRLRNIDQTGMRVLYPTAKHDRFSHSLGVFHLGQKAVAALQKDSFDKIFSKEDYKRNEVLFLIACLLHDIGHTPFSHSLEEQILEDSLIIESKEDEKASSDNKRTINVCLIELINEKESAYCKENKIAREPIATIKAAPHEQLGSYLILDKFKDRIKSIEHKCDIWKGEITFNDDLCFIVRMIMGIKYQEWLSDRQARNCFIELLNGDNFDVDKLDYILRDTQMSGINNVSIDVERLLSSLCIIKKTRHINKVNLLKTNIENLTISEISNNDANNIVKIDGKYKGVIKILAGTIVEIGEGSQIEVFKGADHEFAEISYTSGDLAVFDAATKLKLESKWIYEDEKTGYSDKVKELIGKPNKFPFNTYIENATLLSPFKFKTESDIEVYICGFCTIMINGKFQSIGSLKLSSLNELRGAISIVEILGNTFTKKFTILKFPSKNGYYTYSIGFKKQAINVIANVLEARNYLYLWVYAHHKVIYSANFLIPVITKKIAEYCGNDASFPSWKLNYDNLDKLDDYYIWTVMKYIRNNSGKFKLQKEYIDLIDQLFSRNYNKSLYKSLAEFELVFGSFTEERKLEVLKKLKDNTDTNKPLLGAMENNNYNAGYLKSDCVEKINEKIMEVILEAGDASKESNTKLAEVLYVITEFKQKKLNPNKLYLDMGDEILPISQIPLLFEPHIANENAEDKYFYIYYKEKEEGQLPLKANTIKKAIRKWLN